MFGKYKFWNMCYEGAPDSKGYSLFYLTKLYQILLKYVLVFSNSDRINNIQNVKLH